MRIECHTLEDFIENLSSKKIFDKCVFVDRTRTAMNATAGGPGSSYQVVFQASAVIIFEDNGEALLDVGILCGVDRETHDGGDEGTQEQTRLYEQLKLFCEQERLKLLPGRLDL